MSNLPLALFRLVIKPGEEFGANKMVSKLSKINVKTDSYSVVRRLVELHRRKILDRPKRGVYVIPYAQYAAITDKTEVTKDIFIYLLDKHKCANTLKAVRDLLVLENVTCSENKLIDLIAYAKHYELMHTEYTFANVMNLMRIHKD